LARWKQPRGQRARSSCSVLLNSQSRRRQGGTHQRKPATPDQLKLKTDAESLPRCAPLRAFLVGADHHRLGKDVSMHRLLQSWLFRRLAADLLRDAYAARTLVCGHQPLADSTKVVQFAVAHTLVFTFFPNWLKHLHDGLGSLTTRVLAVNVPEGVQPRSTRCGPRYATSKA